MLPSGDGGNVPCLLTVPAVQTFCSSTLSCTQRPSCCCRLDIGSLSLFVLLLAGGMHVLAVTSCGQVWGWGSNECGQLGLGHSKAWVAAPTEVTAALDGAWKVRALFAPHNFVDKSVHCCSGR